MCWKRVSRCEGYMSDEDGTFAGGKWVWGTWWEHVSTNHGCEFAAMTDDSVVQLPHQMKLEEVWIGD